MSNAGCVHRVRVVFASYSAGVATEFVGTVCGSQDRVAGRGF